MFKLNPKWQIDEVSEAVYRAHKVGGTYAGRTIWEMIARADGFGDRAGVTIQGDQISWLIITRGGE